MATTKPYRIVRWKITLPESLAARVELRLPPNHHNTAPGYGVRAKLIEQLLQEWVEEQERALMTTTEGVA